MEDALASPPPPSCPVEFEREDGRTGVLFLSDDCGALPPPPPPQQQQLLLLYPLMWSNPSLSCTVSLRDRYLSCDEAAGCGGSAASSIMDLFSTNASVGFYLWRRGEKKGVGGKDWTAVPVSLTKELKV